MSNSKPEFKRIIDEKMKLYSDFIEYNPTASDYEDFLRVVKGAFAQTQYRSTCFNESVAIQAIELTEKEKKFVCICGVGSNHVGPVKRVQDDKVLEKGIYSRLQAATQDSQDKVAKCYVTTDHSLLKNESYSPPQWNPGHYIYSSIEPVLVVKHISLTKVSSLGFYAEKIKSQEPIKTKNNDKPKKDGGRCHIS